MVLTRREETILDLLDAGLSHSQVVAKGFKLSSVRFAAASMGTAATNRTADLRREAAIRRGSQQLLKAIQQERRA